MKRGDLVGSAASAVTDPPPLEERPANLAGLFAYLDNYLFAEPRYTEPPPVEVTGALQGLERALADFGHPALCREDQALRIARGGVASAKENAASEAKSAPTNEAKWVWVTVIWYLLAIGFTGTVVQVIV